MALRALRALRLNVVPLFLFIAAVVGGALNSVAGGGSFITLPALAYGGIPAVAANATSTPALWPGSVASAVAYRREVTAEWRWLAILGGVSLAGGLIGALLLVRTSDTSFLRLLPWLMLVAVATFTFGGSQRPRGRRRAPGLVRGAAAIPHIHLRRLLRWRHGDHDAGDAVAFGDD